MTTYFLRVNDEDRIRKSLTEANATDSDCATRQRLFASVARLIYRFFLGSRAVLVPEQNLFLSFSFLYLIRWALHNIPQKAVSNFTYHTYIFVEVQ